MENKIAWFIAISVLVFALGIVGLAFSFNIWAGIIASGLAGAWIGSLLMIGVKRINKK